MGEAKRKLRGPPGWKWETLEGSPPTAKVGGAAEAKVEQMLSPEGRAQDRMWVSTETHGLQRNLTPPSSVAE